MNFVVTLQKPAEADSQEMQELYDSLGRLAKEHEKGKGRVSVQVVAGENIELRSESRSSLMLFISGGGFRNAPLKHEWTIRESIRPIRRTKRR